MNRPSSPRTVGRRDHVRRRGPVPGTAIAQLIRFEPSPAGTCGCAPARVDAGRRALMMSRQWLSAALGALAAGWLLATPDVSWAQRGMRGGVAPGGSPGYQPYYGNVGNQPYYGGAPASGQLYGAYPSYPGPYANQPGMYPPGYAPGSPMMGTMGGT